MDFKDLAKSMKNLVSEQVEVPDEPNSNIKVTPNIPTPSTSYSPSYPQPADQEAIKALDEKSKAKFDAAINAKNPHFYKKLNDLLSTLAEDMPNEGSTYKTAIKLLAKEGATSQLLISDLDLCISAVEENNKDFSESADKKLLERIGSRKANIATFDQTLAQKQQQIEALQADIVNLTAQKTNEANSINDETKKINLGKERFIIVYNQIRNQLQKQRDNIINYSK